MNHILNASHVTSYAVTFLQASTEIHLLEQGGKQSRKLPAPSFLRNQMYEWHGDRMTAPSDSDSEGSDPPASSDSQHSQSSQDGDGASQHESDLGDFIVDDNPAADDRGPDEEGDVEPGPSATAVSALLEEAGMVSSRTDKEHFTIYIEYLVYDLVDNTFAVRVRGDSRLRKHFDVAVRHVEESLAFKRCAVPWSLLGNCWSWSGWYVQRRLELVASVTIATAWQHAWHVDESLRAFCVHSS